MMKKIVLIFLLGLFSVSALAELEVIPLKHRNAEDIVPLLRPFVDEDGVVNGMNNQVMVRTSPANLLELKKIITELDVVPHRLKITVMQDVDRETVTRMTALSGSLNIGQQGRVSLPGDPRNNGMDIEFGQDGDLFQGQLNNQLQQENDKKTQQVQVIDGGRALIRVGQIYPVEQNQLVQSPWGDIQQIGTTEYRNASSGFYVRPRLNGELVTVEISTQNDSVDFNNDTENPFQDTQQLNTTVTGQLGEWMTLGDMSQQSEVDNNGMLNWDNRNINEQRNVLLKVEVLP